MLLEAKPDASDEIFHAAELGLCGAQQSLIKLDLLVGQVQKILNPGLLLCK